jgi:hypothetical protein
LGILINQGAAGLIKLVAKLIHIFFHRVQGDILNGSTQDLITIWRHNCKHKGNFIQISKVSYIQQATKIELKVREAASQISNQSFTELAVDYRPQIIGNSSLFADSQDVISTQIDNFCMLMPSHFLVHKIYLKYSIASKGLDSYSTLIETWKKIPGPSMILVLGKRKHVRFM